MLKKRVFTMVFLLFFLFVPYVDILLAAQENGEVYFVQKGDSLLSIASRYYKDPASWPFIANGTNAKAREDSSFDTISDPHYIIPGQKLWIPLLDGYHVLPLVVAPVKQPRSSNIEQAFLDAVEDARVVESDEISRSLSAVVESNSDLIWRGESGEKDVLVATWTSWDGYDDKVGQSMTLSREVWITLAPQMQDFFKRFEGKDEDAVILRAEQILGLPPHDGKTKFVEMWVDTDDLFRPAPDPDISDHEALMVFPSSKYLVLSNDYISWFNDLKGSSYAKKNGYPWTRLGYTYDWGNPVSDVGLSEFVVMENADVEIKGVWETIEYLR